MSAVSSLASIFGITGTAAPVTAAIGAVDPKTGLQVEGSLQAFQYFPETISDTRQPEWSRRSAPGGSHPIMSFINGGERNISFTAIFTQDNNPEEQGLLGAALAGTFSFGLSDILGKARKDTVDIAAAIVHLRKFVYPIYDDNLVASPPPFVVVYLPNSGIIGHLNFKDSIVGVMTQCDVTYEAFHRNGSPRIVAVSIAISEVVQLGENWKYMGSEDFIFYQPNGPYTREVIGAAPPKGLLGKIFG